MTTKKYDFDYLVIGSGPAGTTAALELARRKKQVGIVEGRYFGGANLNLRDVPYKVALDSVHNYYQMTTRPEIRAKDASFSLPSLASERLKAIIATGGGSTKEFEAARVKCIKGYANLIDEHTVAVGDKKYTATNIILATGSRLKTLGITGVETVKYLSPDTAIMIRRLPKVVAVVGAGSTGCEIAEFYAELGVNTILLETAERILPKEDKEAGETLSSYFSRELGMTVVTGARVVALAEDEVSKQVIFRFGNSEKIVRVEAIVLATGSEPVMDYGLENAGVKYRNSGIVVDKYFQTTAKNIYAIGDVLGNESSTERAVSDGMTLATNLTERTKTALNYKGMVRVTETWPEIATVGLNEDDLIRRDRGAQKILVPVSETVAGKIHELRYGFVKIMADKNGHILGATIMAPGASAMAAEIAVAIRHNLTVLEIASTPHQINDYNYMVKLATKRLAKSYIR